MSVEHWLLRRARATPDAPALAETGHSWTFSQLADHAARGARHVQTHATAGDAPIALLLAGDSRFATWFHAVSLAGRTVLPLNFRLTTDELARQLADAGVRLLLGEDGDKRLAALRARVAGLDARPVPVAEALPPPLGRPAGAEVDLARTLAVLFTSGTTGRAKGACLSWGNFDASARAARQRLGPAVSGRWLACMPLYHVGGLSILLRSAIFGGPVLLQSHFDPAAVSAALEAGDVAGLSLVPTMLSRLLAFRGEQPAPPGLRVLLLGGAATPPALLQRALAARFPVCLTYGLTEAASQVATGAPPPPGVQQASPVRPLPGVELRIVAGGHDLPAGETGEIVVRGPIVMQGYLGDHEATARTLRDGWLYTGDVGFLDAAGGLHVRDRRDDLVVSGGENVYPAEVEAVLLGHPDVAEAGVTGVPDDDLGSRVVAWLVLRPDVAPDAQALARFCRGQLAGFKVPREFRFVGALPRTAAGKLRRTELPGIVAGE